MVEATGRFAVLQAEPLPAALHQKLFALENPPLGYMSFGSYPWTILAATETDR